MTPFGEKLRELRAAKKITQRDMAAALQISAAYLSALEHGRRGTPAAGLVHQLCHDLGLIWDDADELRNLARSSRPRVKISTVGLTPEQTALANRLARDLRHVSGETVIAMNKLLDNERS